MRLARERALYRYSSALEQGDFDAVATVLREAETDEALERMILEVNDVYRAELGGQPVEARTGEHPFQLTGRRAAWRRRRGGDMADTKSSSTRRPLLGGRRLAPGWIVGGVVTAMVVTCLAAALLAGALRGGVGRQLASSSVDYDEYAPGLSAPQLVEEVVVEREVEAYGQAAVQATVAVSGPDQERLIIRTGSLTLRVEDTLAAQQAVEDLVARWSGEGAYVVSSEQRGGDDDQDPYISMAIRVPAARFGEAMDTIADLAVDVDSRTENSDDVTEEYVDLAGRLEALEAARDRLLEIMAEADRTEDLLQAEEQLTRREAEIEATQGRMQYLSQSAALARISIQLQPYVLSQPVGQRWRPAETVREALEALLEGAQDLVDFLLFFSIAVLPWLLALALVLYLLYRVVRWAVRRQRRRQAETEVEPGT